MTNPKQREAIEHKDGPLLIVAGPGTGKTFTLVRRLERLMREVPPEKLLAVTFTNRAAEEMRERLGEPRVTIGTFHSISLRILAELGVPFEVKGEEDFEKLLVLAMEHYRGGRWTHLLIDEFQDTDPVQWEWIRRLAAPHNNVCAIGDPDQAIYAFRGADAGNFLNFAGAFPGAREIHLEENYRSSATIVEAAGQVIRNNRARIDHAARAQNAEGVKIRVVPCPTEKSEAEQIVKEIEKLLGGTSHFAIDSGRATEDADGSLGFGDMAILYRLNAQRAAIQEALDRAGIPYQILGGSRWTEADDVKKILASAQTLDDVPDNTRLKHLARSVSSMQELRSLVALAGSADHFDPRAERVTLMTIHASKGLEFPAVFIAGCEEGLLPGDGGDVEESRRLFYVAMTRAKRRLYLLYSRSRRLFGKSAQPAPSRFLGEMQEALTRIEQERRYRGKKPPQADSQKTLF